MGEGGHTCQGTPLKRKNVTLGYLELDFYSKTLPRSPFPVPRSLPSPLNRVHHLDRAGERGREGERGSLSESICRLIT